VVAAGDALAPCLGYVQINVCERSETMDLCSSMIGEMMSMTVFIYTEITLLT
jgi:hypothetical protein